MANMNVPVERQMQIFEMEMMRNLYAKMTDSCLEKCIPPRYSDGSLTKGESVCLDRCAAKFMETYMHVSKTLGNMATSGTA